MTEIAEGARDIIDFWFGEIGPERWWTRADTTDAAIAARFGPLREEWHTRPVDDFLGTAYEALAAVVLFDQFPRNMFRHQAAAFATDGLALAIAKGALDRGYDEQLDGGGLSFLYLPFMHSEDLIEQDRSAELFGTLGLAEPLRFAELHRDMIVRFGRFPARNAALGRADLPGEAEAIEQSKDW